MWATSELIFRNFGGLSLSGNIPEAIGNLTNLERLDLGSNELNGTIPEAIGMLSNLTFLNLSNNQLSESIPNSILDLTALISCDLNLNPELCRMEGFTKCGQTNVTEIPGIFVSQSITLLVCSDDCLMMSSWKPELFSKYSCCGHPRITCTGGRITELWVTSILIFRNLKGLSLDGAIPDAIGDFTKLVILDLSTNNISGIIPKSIGMLISLEYLDLGFNLLSGAVDSIEEPGDLKARDLSTNQILNSIPESIGMLTSLRFLSLRNNNLSGVIPDVIGQLTSLTFLNLSNNRFSGSIPKSIINFSALTGCDMNLNPDLCRQQGFTKCGADISGIQLPQLIF
jgi:Leucine-rich repeat (LRR) protein